MNSISPAISMSLNSALARNQTRTAGVLEQMATGSAINRGADDPAGLIASENLRADLSAGNAAIKAAERNEALLNIRDGALGAQMDNIADLDGLVIQAASPGGSTGSEMDATSTQVDGILSGIERVLPATGIDIMRDVTTEMQVGTDEGTGDPIYETVSLSDLSRVIDSDPAAAQRLVDGAREAIVEERAAVGAAQRGAESERRALEEQQINTAAANSSIRDTDYAAASAARARSGILEQASIATILAARQSQTNVLQLLDIAA